MSGIRTWITHAAVFVLCALCVATTFSAVLGMALISTTEIEGTAILFGICVYIYIARRDSKLAGFLAAMVVSGLLGLLVRVQSSTEIWDVISVIGSVTTGFMVIVAPIGSILTFLGLVTVLQVIHFDLAFLVLSVLAFGSGAAGRELLDHAVRALTGPVNDLRAVSKPLVSFGLVYIVVATLFAFILRSIFLIDPSGSFILPPGLEQGSILTFLCYSISLLSMTSLMSVSPVSIGARLVAVIESLAGIFLFVVFVSFVVADGAKTNPSNR